MPNPYNQTKGNTMIRTYFAKIVFRSNALIYIALHNRFPFVFIGMLKLAKGKLVEHDFSGICPECGEHTSAGESCCGRGAYVEDGIVSDEYVTECIENPRICIRLLKDANQEYAAKVNSALFKARVSSTMFSGTYLGTEYRTSSGVVTKLSETIDLGISRRWPTGQLLHLKTREHVYGAPKYKGWNVNIFLDAE